MVCQVNYQTGYISDGYTLSGFIKESRGLHPSLSFKYRPKLVQDRSIIQDRISQSIPSKAEEIKATAIASSLEEWNLLTPEGEAVPISIPHVLRCQPSLSDRLYMIVSGFGSTDINPEWGVQDRNLVGDEELDRALGGPAANEENAVKNS